MQVLNLFAIIGIVFLVSCKSKPSIVKDKDGAYLIDVFELDRVSAKDHFQVGEVKAFQLAVNDDVMLSDHLDVIYSSKDIFVYDHLQNALLRFNQHGEFLNKVGMLGAAPDEYQLISSFLLDTLNRTIEMVCDNGTIIKKYAYEGEFISSEKPIIPVSSHYRTINQTWYYSATGNGETYYRLHLEQEDGNLIPFLSLETDFPGFIEQCFSNHSDILLYKETYLTAIYKIEENEPKPFVRFNFGKGQLTEVDLKNESPMALMERLFAQGFHLLFSIVNNQHLFVAQCVHLKDGTESYNFEVVFNEKNLKGVQVHFDTEGFGQLFSIAKLLHINRDNLATYWAPAMEFTATMDKLNVSHSFNPEGNIIVFTLPLNEQ